MAKRDVIAIVDDDPLVRETVDDLLASSGYSSVVFASGQQLLKSKRLGTFACLVTDIRMPRMSGIQLYRRLVATGHDIPTILITAYPDEADQARVLAEGVLCYLPKPFAPDVLLRCIATALATRPGPSQNI
ncbi:MAG TPA: response regulator [Burkholderiaceae bacterium]|nr:response regulator [Burkholderiaceae bacterium]